MDGGRAFLWRRYRRQGQRAAGFTMIELIIVVVILGILAAVAVPRFANLSGSARDAAVWGVAGAISSANVANVAACGAGYASCVSVSNCTGGSALLQTGLAAGYTITAASVGSGVTDPVCVLTDDTSGATATFTVTGAP
ncbi:MAG: prepilin-type N-terminal cleavage/methylation domain-containing protein [Magnetococcales bacterium]|nr:prepilin-type N-terminal cleavage/methylation domain-containing protein [Magnetococcales bacterium]